ncbi:MAG: pectinesterase family protein, partial [Ilumatobacter sp.]|nr:pectinesterase family protein [Ilumatobacter sp.]
TDLVVDVSGYYIASSRGSGEQGPKGDPGEDADSPARVIWVADDGTGDFLKLSTALASITDATATKPYVIKIAPGTYTEEANVAMKNYVDVEGSGQDITTIKGSCVVPAGGGDLERSTISFGKVNSQIRQLTIEAISENNCVGVYSAQEGGEYSPSMEFVTVLSKSSGSSAESYAILNETSKLVVANSELTADGLTSAAMYNEDSDVQLLNSTATASVNTVSYGIRHEGVSTTVIRNSTIEGGNNSLYQEGSDNGVFYVANTQLATAKQSSSSAAMCFAGVFDSDFKAVSGDTCP